MSRESRRRRSGGTPEDRAWADYSATFREEIMPHLLSSEIFLAIYDGDADVDNADIKFATQIGLMLLHDKPIILTHLPGVTLPERLVRVADEVLSLDLDDPASQEAMVVAMRRVAARYGQGDTPQAGAADDE